jgi:hypothetical protein
MLANARRLVLGLLMAALLAAALAAPTTATGTRARPGWFPNGTVDAIALTKTRVYIGGKFTTMTNSANGNKVRAGSLAALDRRTGALVRTWHASAFGTVHALSVFDNKLIVGGNFTQIDGHPRLHLAALGLVHGDLRTFFVPATNAGVYAMVPIAARIYIGGRFTQVNGTHAPKLAALDRLGHRISNWPVATVNGSPAVTDKTVYTLAKSYRGRSVVVGGAFHTLVSAARPFLGEVGIKTGKPDGWSPHPGCTKNCFVLKVVVAAASKMVYAGIAGPGGQLRAYRATDGSTKYLRPANGDLQAVAVHGDQLFVGGHFTRFDHANHAQIAMLHAGSGRLTGFRPSVSGPSFPGVESLSARADFLRVGGFFTNLGGHPHYAELPN